MPRFFKQSAAPTSDEGAVEGAGNFGYYGAGGFLIGAGGFSNEGWKVFVGSRRVLLRAGRFLGRQVLGRSDYGKGNALRMNFGAQPQRWTVNQTTRRS